MSMVEAEFAWWMVMVTADGPPAMSKWRRAAAANPDLRSRHFGGKSCPSSGSTTNTVSLGSIRR